MFYLVILSAFISTVAADTTCDTGWFKYENSCYTEIKEVTSFNQAKSLCSMFNAIPVTIHSEAEQKFINGIFRKNKPYYIGLIYKNNGWEWLDGKSLTYSNWRYQIAPPTEAECPLFGCGEPPVYWQIRSCNANGQLRSVICKKAATKVSHSLKLHPDPITSNVVNRAPTALFAAKSADSGLVKILKPQPFTPKTIFVSTLAPPITATSKVRTSKIINIAKTRPRKIKVSNKVETTTHAPLLTTPGRKRNTKLHRNTVTITNKSKVPLAHNLIVRPTVPPKSLAKKVSRTFKAKSDEADTLEKICDKKCPKTLYASCAADNDGENWIIRCTGYENDDSNDDNNIGIEDSFESTDNRLLRQNLIISTNFQQDNENLINDDRPIPLSQAVPATFNKNNNIQDDINDDKMLLENPPISAPFSNYDKFLNKNPPTYYRNNDNSPDIQEDRMLPGNSAIPAQDNHIDTVLQGRLPSIVNEKLSHGSSGIMDSYEQENNQNDNQNYGIKDNNDDRSNKVSNRNYYRNENTDHNDDSN